MRNTLGIKLIFVILSMVSLFGCGEEKELLTVGKVDITKYAGTWFEIARLPNSFEKSLNCVSATYSLRKDGKIDVVNAGFKKGKVRKEIKGQAWVPNKAENAKLKVQFFWPFAGNYWILALDSIYMSALVGDPSRKYLWILSKSKQMEKVQYKSFLQIAKEKGFDVSKLILVDQSCSN